MTVADKELPDIFAFISRLKRLNNVYIDMLSWKIITDLLTVNLKGSPIAVQFSWYQN